MERVAGIEPARPAWEAGRLPLHHTRSPTVDSVFQFELQGSKQPVHGECEGRSDIESNRKASRLFLIDLGVLVTSPFYFVSGLAAINSRNC